jgi:sortase (surface protein transpeptidase)
MRDRFLHHPRRALGAAGVALAFVLPTGCAGTAPPAPPPAGTEAAVEAAPTAAPTALPEAKPTRLLIPAIDVDTTAVIELGLNPDRSLEVPPDATTVGWYTRAPTPGERGPAVLAAHVDWKGQEGAFFDLHEMKPGDEIIVERADGRTARFAVRRVERHPKDQFPTTQVYGAVDTPQLRLITCGGDFNNATRSYRDNIIVFADMVGSTAS